MQEKIWTILRTREKGQALTEYGLILGLIVVGAIVFLIAMGSGLASQLSSVASAL